MCVTIIPRENRGKRASITYLEIPVCLCLDFDMVLAIFVLSLVVRDMFLLLNPVLKIIFKTSSRPKPHKNQMVAPKELKQRLEKSSILIGGFTKMHRKMQASESNVCHYRFV